MGVSRGEGVGSIQYIGLGHGGPKKCRMALNGGTSRLLPETARYQDGVQLPGRGVCQGRKEGLLQFLP